jgi:hypothetical protein
MLLVFFVGCEPHFESGNTQCSDKGECPSGFVCSDNGFGAAHTCVTRPSSCAGARFYCATSNTCWDSAVACSTVFNCGTSTSPDYRVCVAAGRHPDCNGTTCLPNSDGSAGTGGSGGSGGSGVCPSTPVTSICLSAASSSTNACGTCIENQCCGQLTACSIDTNCSTNFTGPLWDAVSVCSVSCCSAACSGGGADAGVSDARVPDAAVPDARTPDGRPQACPTPAAGGTCNVFPSCGCPTGQVCYPDTPSTGLKCFPSTGLGEGADCTSGGGMCADGFGCFGGVCKNYCQSDSDCPAVDTARACLPTVWSSTGADILGVSVCARVCDPVSPQNPRSPLLACPVGFGCDSGDSFPGVSGCRRQSGTGVEGSACLAANDCVPGYYCSLGNVCMKFCFANADCPAGTTCNPFSPLNYAGTTQVGYCHSP